MQKNTPAKTKTSQSIPAPTFDTKLLLKTLTAFKKGDFSARLPNDWTGIEGKIADTLNDVIEINGRLTKREMMPGDTIHVSPKTVHRMTAIEDCDVFEVSTPELDDVVRLEDRYGREGT